MMFKGWLRGLHHSVDPLQNYLEYNCYKFNRSIIYTSIFDNLILKAVLHKPVMIKNLIIDLMPNLNVFFFERTLRSR